jgi:hypothetical protein
MHSISEYLCDWFWTYGNEDTSRKGKINQMWLRTFGPGRNISFLTILIRKKRGARLHERTARKYHRSHHVDYPLRSHTYARIPAIVRGAPTQDAVLQVCVSACAGFRTGKTFGGVISDCTDESDLHSVSTEPSSNLTSPTPSFGMFRVWDDFDGARMKRCC